LEYARGRGPYRKTCPVCTRTLLPCSLTYTNARMFPSPPTLCPPTHMHAHARTFLRTISHTHKLSHTHFHTHARAHTHTHAHSYTHAQAHTHIHSIHAQVADYGKSRLLGPSGIIKAHGYATITHMAPEMLTDLQLTPAADVYAFGILLWQVGLSLRAYPCVIMPAFHVTCIVYCERTLSAAVSVLHRVHSIWPTPPLELLGRLFPGEIQKNVATRTVLTDCTPL